MKTKECIPSNLITVIITDIIRYKATIKTENATFYIMIFFL